MRKLNFSATGLPKTDGAALVWVCCEMCPIASVSLPDSSPSPSISAEHDVSTATPRAMRHLGIIVLMFFGIMDTDWRFDVIFSVDAIVFDGAKVDIFARLNIYILVTNADITVFLRKSPVSTCFLTIMCARVSEESNFGRMTSPAKIFIHRRAFVAQNLENSLQSRNFVVQL